MITFARDYYPQEKFPNISLMQIDATELTFDSEFDCCVFQRCFSLDKSS
jgi:hypothetical protein